MAHGVRARWLLRESIKATRPLRFPSLLGGFGKWTIEVRSLRRICVDVRSHGCVGESPANSGVVAFFIPCGAGIFIISGQL